MPHPYPHMVGSVAASARLARWWAYPYPRVAVLPRAALRRWVQVGQRDPLEMSARQPRHSRFIAAYPGCAAPRSTGGTSRCRRRAASPAQGGWGRHDRGRDHTPVDRLAHRPRASGSPLPGAACCSCALYLRCCRLLQLELPAATCRRKRTLVQSARLHLSSAFITEDPEPVPAL